MEKRELLGLGGGDGYICNDAGEDCDGEDEEEY